MPGGVIPGVGTSTAYGSEVGTEHALQDMHPAYREKAARSRSTSGSRRITSGSTVNTVASPVATETQGPPYPVSEVERREAAQAAAF